jgi:hypothetical protein
MSCWDTVPRETENIHVKRDDGLLHILTPFDDDGATVSRGRTDDCMWSFSQPCQTVRTRDRHGKR